MAVANFTPRLQLPAPVDSDPFSASDFSTQNNILDANPGIKIVPAYNGTGGLSTLNYTQAQHGSLVLQADRGALWYWYQPTSSAGSWKRANSIGLITRTTQNADVSTTATSGNGVLAVSSGNFTVPGGRYIGIDVEMGLDGTSGPNSTAKLNITDNGDLIREKVWIVGQKFSGFGQNQVYRTVIAPGANNSSHNINVYIRSVAGSTDQGRGGTTTSRAATIAISEI